jgi:SAM-dependent methyltransferase
MHTEAYEYTRLALARVGGAAGKDVLEIGSVNINGGVRELCAGAASYWGIDKEGGPGVDEVVDAADYLRLGTFELDPVEVYDLVICNEVLEHEPDPSVVIACAWRALRPGGHLILTCAGEGRKPHGARGSEHPPAGEHYRNINTAELEQLLDGWFVVDLHGLYPPGDSRCIARKPEAA